MAEGSDDPQFAKIDQALALWRQGDLALDEKWFVQVADGSSPPDRRGRQGAPVIAVLVTLAGSSVLGWAMGSLHCPFWAVALGGWLGVSPPSQWGGAVDRWLGR